MSVPRPLRPLLPFVRRVALLYLGLRALLFALSMFLMAVGGDRVDHPLGIVLLSTATAMADLYRRHEAVLWANLGHAPGTMALLAASVAGMGEVVWVFM